jgi:outer membrane protein assembly factor BamE (lipoprotein component of BamABCDE complex)
MKNILALLALSSCLSLLSGCMSASQHAAEVQGGPRGDTMTVGKVQREIRTGMSGEQVAGALGSPNIVTTDEEGREVWIYDRVATDRVYSTSSGGVSSLILGATGDFLLGAGSAGYSGSSGAASTSQRTLTVIIKFDKEGKVRDFAYHSSRF